MMLWDSHPLVICGPWLEHAEKDDRKLPQHSPSSLKSTATMTARNIPNISTYKLWL